MPASSSSSPSQFSSAATASGNLNSDLLGLDAPTGSSPVSWNQSLMDSSYPQSSTPSPNQSQQPLQPSPVFNQSGAILQPSPVFNQSGASTASQSGATLQPSPAFNQSGSPTHDQSENSQSEEQRSPVPHGTATPVPSEEEVSNLG